MKRKLCRFMLAMCLMTCLFTTTAFAADTGVNAIPEDLSEYVEYYVEGYIETYCTASSDELKFLSDNSVGSSKKLADSINDYVSTGTVGKMLSVGEVKVVKNGDIYVATAPVTYENGVMTLTFKMQFLVQDIRLTDSTVTFKSTENKPLGEVMAQAGINTAIGIGIVFIMLAVMSVIIAQFKHINTIVAFFGGIINAIRGIFVSEEVTEVPEGVENAVNQIVENETNEVDDLELVAVITAAIAASEDAPADGFIVRSIRRVRF